MKCQDIDRYLDTQSSGLPEEVQAHLEGCERCRRLVEALQSPVTAPEIPPAVESRIEHAIRRDLKAVSPLRSERYFVALILGVAALMWVSLAAYGGIRGLRSMSLLQLVAVGFVLIAGTVGLAISLSRRMVPGSRVSLRPGALLLAVGGSFLGVVALLYPWRSEGPFVEWGLLCTGPGLLFSLVPAVAFWLILRRGAILEPASLGALAGFLAGLVGATGLHLQCWVIEAPHAAVWHLAVPVICAVLGYVLGKVIR